MTSPASACVMPAGRLAALVDGLDWERIGADLDEAGHALTGPLLTPSECSGLSALYEHDQPFRSRVVMERHGFGKGEYKYFADPLPEAVANLRALLYRRLAPVANRWATAMALDHRYPADHGEFLDRCHAAGQRRPTPLLLKYRPGDYNCLHQDLYGETVFPLQMAVLLSVPGTDFSGGEFVLTEQRPRMQSRATVVPLSQGMGVVFAVDQRPVQGIRGTYRVRHRHGVSLLRSGERFMLGIIFHDAA
ncbi:2OG-Fe(II) oxygenase [Azospirillum picis]|uniref:Fe2OG dioxygenase domain-containing protein n=1 Tax=Azospirillum picis TaxID=488438 RepID=A0ABU0MH33_9PROT|nr:2OG-Fe(II) oxygenase [Azospirillum picis]MBP2299003.1 hypothetical protein [Azospirillum picis]MDQ0532755.1 hypothetical protein [Azospirillum picis]